MTRCRNLTEHNGRGGALEGWVDGFHPSSDVDSSPSVKGCPVLPILHTV